MGGETVRGFYDDLAPEYHWIYPDWDPSIERQRRAFQRLIVEAMGNRRVAVLDCACGIGTQAIGLAHNHRPAVQRPERSYHRPLRSPAEALAASRTYQYEHDPSISNIEVISSALMTLRHQPLMQEEPWGTALSG